MHHESLPEALPGDNVRFNVKNVVVKALKRGFIASNSKDDPAKEAANFTSQVIVVNLHGQIGNKYVVVFECHTSQIVVKFAELITKIDGRFGNELEKEPKFLKNDNTRMVKMISTQPMVAETFSEYPPFGCFTVRVMRKTMIVGVIKSIGKKVPISAKVTKSVARKNFYMTFYGTNFSMLQFNDRYVLNLEDNVLFKGGSNVINLQLKNTNMMRTKDDGQLVLTASMTIGP
ncbi:hypothetical protein GQ457_05G029820 [Hibiscus cannabinus]